jgi:hypothetical protein
MGPIYAESCWKKVRVVITPKLPRATTSPPSNDSLDISSVLGSLRPAAHLECQARLFAK